MDQYPTDYSYAGFNNTLGGNRGVGWGQQPMPNPTEWQPTIQQPQQSYQPSFGQMGMAGGTIGGFQPTSGFEGRPPEPPNFQPQSMPPQFDPPPQLDQPPVLQASGGPGLIGGAPGPQSGTIGGAYGSGTAPVRQPMPNPQPFGGATLGGIRRPAPDQRRLPPQQLPPQMAQRWMQSMRNGASPQQFRQRLGDMRRPQARGFGQQRQSMPPQAQANGLMTQG